MWEIFFLKNHAENEVGRLVPRLSFLKKLYVGFFGRPRPGYTRQTNFVTF